MRQLSFDVIESARDFGFKPAAYQEFSLDGPALSDDSEVLPLLSELSHTPDERWLTCVNTPSLPKGMAQAADIAPQAVLKVQSSEKLTTAEVIMKALRAGRSHTVIGFCESLTVSQREELRQCAELADCQCLVLNQDG